MKTQVNKWGSSLGVRIPHKLADDAGIREGVTVDITLKDGVLAIKRPEYSLDALLTGSDPKKLHRGTDVDFGRPLGREIW